MKTINSHVATKNIQSVWKHLNMRRLTIAVTESNTTQCMTIIIRKQIEL